MFQKLKNNLFLSKLSVISSYLWLIGTLAFSLVIIFSTKGFSIDPCYGEGCPENNYLIPMLASFFVGSFFFGLTIVSGILRKLLKSKMWKPPLSLGSWKIGSVTFLIVLIICVYFVAISKGRSESLSSNYSGYDLFNSVNSHRKSIGVPEIKLSEGLCDNLVERWKAVKEGRQHGGFEEWVKQEGIQANYGYKDLVELYIVASTTDQAISFWEKSPGHQIQLDNPKWIDGCAYANEGYGVVIMGIK